MTWNRGSLEPCSKSTTPMKSRLRIQVRESSAALAFEKSVGLIQTGAVNVVGAAGTGASGFAGASEDGSVDGDKICELAAPESNNPPAPAAPRRNICLRFNAF